MKSSWRSPDGGSSVARNTKIESCGAVFCARWGTGSTPIRSFHTVSEGVFSEVRGDGVLRSSPSEVATRHNGRLPSLLLHIRPHVASGLGDGLGHRFLLRRSPLRVAARRTLSASPPDYSALA